MSEGLEKHLLSYFAGLTVSKYKRHPTSKLFFFFFLCSFLIKCVCGSKTVFVCLPNKLCSVIPSWSLSLSHSFLTEKEKLFEHVTPHNIIWASLLASSLSSSERMWDQKSRFLNGVTATVVETGCQYTHIHTLFYVLTRKFGPPQESSHLYK